MSLADGYLDVVEARIPGETGPRLFGDLFGAWEFLTLRYGDMPVETAERLGVKMVNRRVHFTGTQNDAG